MRVSVITPCYNSAATLEATIQSVLNQTYPDIEYIIMDGGSKDATAEIVRPYLDRLTFISERDNGQSDAINKGWKRAAGDVLAWLNGDDRYFPDTVKTAVEYFEAHPDAMWLYGTADSVDEEVRSFAYRNFRDDWDYQSLLTLGCYINQPSVFLRREVIEQFGYINENLHFGMDYDYWLRIGKTYPAHYVPEVKVQIIRTKNTKTESGGVQRLQEVERIARSHGATDLPSGMHHEWGWVYTEEFLRNVVKFQWKDAAANFRQMWRYPSTLPRGLMKVFFRWFVPRRVETWLRGRFVR